MPDFQIKLLGEIEVLRGGQPVSLPASRKTRALLAFLVLTGRPHRRDRLCEIFWDIPDDPRASLRWSLSKLRAIVDDADVRRIVADRERVAIVMENCPTDIASIRALQKMTNVELTTLISVFEKLSEGLLSGGGLSNQPEYDSWLQSERQKIDELRAAFAAQICRHPEITPDRALSYAHACQELMPFSRSAAAFLIKINIRLGKKEIADQLNAQFAHHFAEAGLDWEMEDQANADAFDPQESRSAQSDKMLEKQTIQFCRSEDDVTIAFAEVGQGPPLVKAANWLSHLELDWNTPIWSPLFRELALDHRFIRYDARGNGLSDWKVPEISLEKFVTDLETVIDATGITKFPLLGISQGAAVSIEYAVRHPDHVSHLILFGGYPSGWRIAADQQTLTEREAVLALTENGWGQENTAYRHIFSATFMPDASADTLSWFDEFQRRTTSPQNAVRFLSAFGDIDVRDRLSQIAVPTLVLHSRGDLRIPWMVGRDLAASIPGARFVLLESNNHLLLEGEPAADQFVHTVREFLG
ncbi:alpha/beta fold hydrolase [Parasphingorhabdus sp.]|uniref:alpha/beta fold hydrolase n=1 Tax=Parasphingorhabdus sp. TaxID=2709688 RepID=UPI003A8F5548